MITNIQTVSNDTLQQFTTDLADSGKFTTQLTDDGNLLIIQTYYPELTYKIVNGVPLVDIGAPAQTNLAVFPAIDIPNEIVRCSDRIELLQGLMKSNAVLFVPKPVVDVAPVNTASVVDVAPAPVNTASVVDAAPVIPTS